jgi:predicted acylesterase/phospholipase RssA
MKVCLILSGGGSNGIVQVGYCKYFAEKNVQFEVITGTSTGALQGAMYAQNRFDELMKIWYSIGSHKDIYRHHFPFSFLQGIFKKSLYSAAPLRNKIDAFVDVDVLIKSRQRFISCSTNITTQKVHYVESTEDNRHLIKDFIYASAAFPLAFEPVQKNGEYFWDGGLVEPIPVKRAVEACPDADLYIIGLTNPVYEVPKKDFGKTILGFTFRAIESMFQEIWENDIEKGQKYWVDSKFVLLSPDYPPFPSSLEWYPNMYDDKIALGYNIARNVLQGVL